MTKTIFTIQEFISFILDKSDPYYTDIGRLDHIVEKHIRFHNNDMSQWLETELLRARTIFPSDDRTREYIYLIMNLVIFIFISEGLRIKIGDTTLDATETEPDYGYLHNNMQDITLNKKDLKKILEEMKLPLPFALFPKNQNNSLTFTENSKKRERKAYKECFEAHDFDRELALLKSLTPQSVTEFGDQRRLIKEIEQEKFNFINSEDIEQQKHPNISLLSTNTETITCILESLSHDQSVIAQELHRRGVSRERIGQLMNFKKGSSGKDASTKRGSRLLKSKGKRAK